MIALDTNILVYAESPGDREGRHRVALALMEELTRGGSIIPMQVLGEFLNVCRKKQLLSSEAASRRATDYAKVFDTPPTHLDDLTAATKLSAGNTLQFFDALILIVARRTGATILLSEDMQDGREIDGLRIVNPFVAENRALLADFVGSAP